jgi:hypothetical protein
MEAATMETPTAVSYAPTMPAATVSTTAMSAPAAAMSSGETKPGR